MRTGDPNLARITGNDCFVCQNVFVSPMSPFVRFEGYKNRRCGPTFKRVTHRPTPTTDRSNSPTRSQKRNKLQRKSRDQKTNFIAPCRMRGLFAVSILPNELDERVVVGLLNTGWFKALNAWNRTSRLSPSRMPNARESWASYVKLPGPTIE